MYQNQEEIKQIIHDFPDKAIRWLLETPEHDEFLDIIKSGIENKSRREEVEKMGKTMAQVLEARGEARGIELGKITTNQEDIIKLIRLKFDYVPENFIKNIKSTNQIEQLDTIFERIFIAKTIKDVDF
jgi:hypothetical protein